MTEQQTLGIGLVAALVSLLRIRSLTRV